MKRSKRSKGVSISTIIGLAIGMFCVVYGIMGAGHIGSFINAPSFFIIVGGSVGSVVTSFPGSKLKNFGAVLRSAFYTPKINLPKDIQTLVEISSFARSKGTLALENLADEYSHDAFLHKGILMIADGTSKETLVTNLKSEISYMKKRHTTGQAMVSMFGDNATSLGLLGTYIGLIPMLENLENPASLGPLMALELVSSFYGAFISYVVFTPLANRLKAFSADEVLRNNLIIDGLVSIQEGQSPRVVEERLLGALTKKEAKKMSKTKQKKDPIKLKEVA
ncbi:motility protein A [Scatolibacter rhodanostii]|uniref:motility protein A n=1 Tax=Scatolibacter rhodanostii TaxID=2014781 RepID=UPI0013565CE7|nr:MotA/TolQ/ExbB proton channel family protein [Scatolibacter rhodanostii]